MYRITITKEEEVEVTESEYRQIADSGNEKDDGAIYGYVPKKSTQIRETKMLDQRVENLDLPKVIIAVNNITPPQEVPKNDSKA